MVRILSYVKVRETMTFVRYVRAVPDYCVTNFESLDQNSRHLNSMHLYIYRKRAAHVLLL